MVESNPVLETADRLHSVAIHLLRRLRTVDLESEIGPARLSALSVLVFGGEHSLAGLAAAEQVTAATMSRLVRALEADGLVRRHADPSDGRAIRLVATASGRRLLARARRRRLEVFEELLTGLQEQELGTLERAAAILAVALQERA
jgi:DNA-binding MarR family transcriptional regulator